MVAAFKAAYGGNFIAQQIALCKRFKGLGQDIIMIFPEEARERAWSKELIENGWCLRFIPLHDRQISQAKRLIHLIKEEKIDVLHSVFGIYDNPAALACTWCGKECIIHVRAENKYNSPLSKFKRIVKMRFLLNRVHLIAISNNTLHDYTEFGLSLARAAIIENGISVDRLKAGLSREAVRERLEINEKHKVFMMMGYNLQIKGVDTALEAFNLLNKPNNNVAAVLCVIVASGMEQVEKYVLDKFGIIPKWLRLLPPTENVGEYYRGADAFISASRTEGFSNALAEACLMKLPLIISNIVGTNWAQNFETCKVFESGNTMELAECIKRVLIEEKSPEVFEAVKTHVKSQVDLDRWAQRVTEFYQQQKLF